MARPKILVQLDSDRHASVFDAVVAADSDVDQLLQYGAVQPDDVRGLVHGAMFTRGPGDLHQTAIFIGGSDVAAGERLLQQVTACFFGPMRVSVMMDANGANTTAAAAVLTAAEHVPLPGATALVLAATGPVGRRAVRLLAGAGATVRAASRSEERAAAAAADIASRYPRAQVRGCATSTADDLRAALEGVQIVIAAGAAGVQLLPEVARRESDGLRVAIDLNAVPPLGIEGLEVTDKGVQREGVVCYGAIGVGGRKMKIHKACLRRLFERNDQVLDAEEVFALGRALES